MGSINLKNIYSFVGRRAMGYGTFGVFAGFLSLSLDLALATMLQRFFMSTGLIAPGNVMPLDMELRSPSIEGGILILVAACRAALIWLNGYIAGLCQVSVEVEKRRSLAAWSIHQGGQETGYIMSLFSDIIIGAAASIGNIFYIIARFIMAAGIFIAMAFYSLQLTMSVVALIFVLAPLQWGIDRVISRHSKFIQSSLANAVSLLARAIKNNLFISLHNLADSESKHVQTAVDVYGHSSVRYYSLSSLRAVIPQVLGVFAVVCIAVQGSSYFAGNPASMVAYLYMVLRFFQLLSDVARVSGNLRLNYPRIAILYAWWKQNIESLQTSASSAQNEERSLIGWQGRHISYIWPNGHATAIRDMNFDIKPGSITLISGPSGAGKTTLFNILLGLLQPSQGSISIVNAAGESAPVSGRVPYCVSYVGPDPFLVAGTIRDQLLIGNVPHEDNILADILRRVQADFVFGFKDGLDHKLTEQGLGLSAGQKQRLALARALLRRPSILLLDEATANLDEQTERLIIDLVNSLRGQMSILVISHRPHQRLQVDNTINLGQY